MRRWPDVMTVVPTDREETTMNARPSLLLAGCLFALPAFLPAQAQPPQDATAQLRAAVERLRAADLTPAQRARLMETLEALHDKLEAMPADSDAQDRAKAKYDKLDRARKAQADEEAVRVYERAARTPPADDSSAHYERA